MPKGCNPHKPTCPNLRKSRECRGASCATARPGGFDDVHLAQLQALLPFFGLAIKSRITYDIGRTVVETYLGRDAGDRVLTGAIDRGSLETIRAVLWFCDLRGFTHVSDRLPGDELVETLSCRSSVRSLAAVPLRNDPQYPLPVDPRPQALEKELLLLIRQAGAVRNIEEQRDPGADLVHALPARFAAVGKPVGQFAPRYDDIFCYLGHDPVSVSSGTRGRRPVISRASLYHMCDTVRHPSVSAFTLYRIASRP